MPTLDWIGKHSVVEHHQEVPFRLLREVPELSVGDPDNENLLIQGDNLHALKALLPYYAGQVKCIYIDPPYNTGNEGWSYNDNVNSPEIKNWLHETVGKEAEDLSRHDKWLCMMYPRLVLLRELLALDGSFWMSIDDNEVHHARAVLDDVFGANNFVTTICWQKIYTVKNSARHFSEMHDYVLVYASKKETWERNLLGRTAETDEDYTNPDNDPRGPWISNALQSRNYYSKGTYPITCPSGRVIEGPPSGTYWRTSEDNLWKLAADGRVWWGTDGSNAPRIKKYLSEVKDGVVPSTIWFHDEAGHNAGAKAELREILFDADDLFVTPKPTSLLQRILEIATEPGDLVLDSFAGTGTTGHAVLKQNAQDGGSRQFILVELENNVAQDVTRRRLTRAVEGQPYEGAERTELYKEKLGIRELKKADALLAETDRLKKEHADEYDGFERRSEDGYLILRGKKKITGYKEGLGGGFRFFELGPEVFDAEGRVREDVTFEELARHVYFVQTGRPLPRDAQFDSPQLGVAGGTAVYLLYNGVLKDVDPDGGNVLTRRLLLQLSPHDGPKAIYGTACLLSDEQLKQQDVVFRQIPYQVRTS